LPLIGERKLEFWKARAVRSGFFFLATTVSNNHHSGRQGITKISSSPRLHLQSLLWNLHMFRSLKPE
jgi:hypothetical protein